MDNKNNWSRANNILTQLHIIIGHDRTHLSIDASGQDNMTCHITAFINYHMEKCGLALSPHCDYGTDVMKKIDAN